MVVNRSVLACPCFHYWRTKSSLEEQAELVATIDSGSRKQQLGEVDEMKSSSAVSSVTRRQVFHPQRPLTALR